MSDWHQKSHNTKQGKIQNLTFLSYARFLMSFWGLFNVFSTSRKIRLINKRYQKVKWNGQFGLLLMVNNEWKRINANKQRDEGWHSIYGGLTCLIFFFWYWQWFSINKCSTDIIMSLMMYMIFRGIGIYTTTYLIIGKILHSIPITMPLIT